jgi:hypothetical protein
MDNLYSKLLLLPLALVLGCGRAPESSTSAAGSAPDTAPRVNTHTAPRSSSATTPPGTDTRVPKEIQTEGYQYYGLANPSPIPMTRSVGQQTLTGNVVTRFMEAKGGAAFFQQSWTGEFADIGSSDLSADKTGIYTTAVFGQKLPKPQLELPSNPKNGFSWHIHASFKMPTGENVEQDGTDKIVGLQSIKVAGKTYDALLVEENGTLKTGQQLVNVDIKKWLVKNIGTVKLQIDSKDKKGAAQTATLEAKL